MTVQDENTVEGGLSRIMRRIPKMIRFYAVRMMVELHIGYALPPEEARRFYNRCEKASFVREVARAVGLL